MDAEEVREHLRLGLAELGELGRDVADRAVALAQLDAGQRGALADRTGRRGIPLATERDGQRLGAGLEVVTSGVQVVGDPSGDFLRALLGVGRDGFGPGLLGEEAQDVGRERVVVLAQVSVTGLRQDVRPSGTTTATYAAGRLLVLLEQARVSEGVQVASYGSGGETQATGELSGGDRTMLGKRLLHPVTGTRLQPMGLGVAHTEGLLALRRNGSARDNHNTSVT